MPKLKEITELMEADPSLGEQIAVFEDDNSKNRLDSSQHEIEVG
jgi:hypothetical protein